MSPKSLLLLLLPLVLFSLACGAYEPPRASGDEALRETATRQDCNAIMGTVFRSGEERTWFEENCSRWPAPLGAPVSMPPEPPQSQPVPSRAPVVSGERPECAALRSRPGLPEPERLWFQANCSGPSAGAPPQPRSEPQPESISSLPGSGPPMLLPVTPPTPYAGPSVVTAPPNPASQPAFTAPTPAPARMPAPVAVPSPIPTPAATGLACAALQRNPSLSDSERRYYFTHCSQ